MKRSVVQGMLIAAVLALLGVRTTSADTTVYQSDMSGNPHDHNRVAGLGFSVQGAGWPSVLMPVGVSLGGAYHGGELGPFPLMFGQIRTGADGILQGQDPNWVSNRLRYGTGEDSDLYITLTRLSPGILLETGAKTAWLFAPDGSNVVGEIGKVQRHLGAQLRNYSHGWWQCRAKLGATQRIVKGGCEGGKVRPLRWATPGAGGKILTGVLGTQILPDIPVKGVERTPSLAPAPSLPRSEQMADLNAQWMLLWYGSDSVFVHSMTPCVYVENQYLPELIPSPLWPVKGSAYQADVPILLVMEKAPTSIEQGGEGIKITFDRGEGGMGKMVVLPLYGHVLLRADDTEKWLKKFPRDVAARCDAWAARLAEFPVDVTETVFCDARKDRVTHTEDFEFVTVRPGGRRHAPLPAILGLAWHQGLPVSFSGKPENTGLATVWGEVVTLQGNSYTWSLDGLGSLIEARPTIGPSNAKSSPLEQELAVKVDEVLEAGHLGPYMEVWRLPSIFPHLANPAENLYLLCEILPVFSVDSRTALREYLATERAKYPPESVERLNSQRGGQPWGAQREAYDLFSRPDAAADWGAGAGYPRMNDPSPSLWRAYGLARYYEVTDENPADADVLDFSAAALKKTLEGRQWDTFGWFWGKYLWYPHSVGEPTLGQQTPCCVNRNLAGVIGYLKMCRQADQSGPVEAWGLFARLAALRFAMVRYGRYQAAADMVGLPRDSAISARLQKWADFNKPESFVFQAQEIHQYGVLLSNGAHCGKSRPAEQYTFLHMVPEVALMLRKWGLGPDVKRFLDRYAFDHANWYNAKADGAGDGEYRFMVLTDSYQLFMAHAWIAETAPAELERYIDVPWMKRGDFYHMHKLAETIKAYRGVRWE